MISVENWDKAIGAATEQLETNSSVYVEVVTTDKELIGRIHVSHHESLPTFENIQAGGGMLSLDEVNEHIEDATGLKDFKFLECALFKVAEDFGLSTSNFYGAAGANSVAFFNGQYAVSFVWELGENDDAEED